MPKRLAFAATVIACATLGTSLAAAEQGPTKIVTADSQAQRRLNGWVRTSLVPSPPGRISVRFSGCPGFPRFTGCVQMWRPRTIYLRRVLADERKVFIHELGHVFDATVLFDNDRAEFARIHGRRDRWFGAKHPVREWFADAYALCARRRSIPRRPAASDHHYAPSPARHAASCRLIDEAAAR